MPETHGNGFHMVQLWLDARQLAKLGRMLDLYNGRKQVGTNYLAHCALGELFQKQAPGPFCIEDTPRQLSGDSRGGRFVRLLGYTDVDRAALHEVAKGFASPAVYEICDWERAASKPMPDAFPAGMRLGFELRACPVVRKASAGEAQTPNGKRSWSEGEELDAFLSRAWQTDEALDRESVYRDWLKRQLEIRGGAEALSIGMDRFSIERMTRRTHGSNRHVRTIQRPDVTLTGELKVTDGAAFADLLRRGIGRHKSFGFGMLKIRRA